ncbi:MAG TPA: radical SAM protein [bacterium]|nr:radical SAM protein [bacterium]HPN30119.1 radical SAM protein [bacterium]
MLKILKGFNFFRNYFLNHYAIKYGLFLPKPVQVYWNITDNCNFKCVMCGRWRNKADINSEVTVEQMKSVIDELAEWGVFKFGITGGEPFTRKSKTLEVAEYASSKGLWTHIGTNAFLLNIDILKKLKEIGIGHLSISIDGDEQIHDAIRNQTGSYKKIIEVLEWAKEFGTQIKINTVLTSKNAEHIIKTVELAIANKYPIFIQPFNPYDSSILMGQTQKSLAELDGNWISESQNQVLSKTIEAIILKKKQSPELIINDVAHLKNILSYFQNPVSIYSKCVTGYKNIQISSAGDVIACWNFNKPIGNIKTDSLKKIWYSETFCGVRKKMDNCKILCISGCRFYPAPLKLLSSGNIKLFLKGNRK